MRPLNRLCSPYDGSGGFSAYSPGNPVVTGTTISSTAFNNTINDIVSNGLSNVVVKDGQQTITANLPMAGFKFTGLAAGSAAADSVRLSQLQASSTILLNSVAGAPTFTASLTPTLTAYASGQMFILIPDGGNTSTATININSLGVKNIFNNAAACIGGELHAGVPVLIEYDGTQFNLVGIQTSYDSFILTLTGCTTAPTYQAYVSKTGKGVILDLKAAVTGTSNTTAKTLTGVPAAYRPTTASYAYAIAVDNGGAGVMGIAVIESTGVVTLYPTLNSVSWTNSGTFSFGRVTLVYTLN